MSLPRGEVRTAHILFYSLPARNRNLPARGKVLLQFFFFRVSSIIAKHCPSVAIWDGAEILVKFLFLGRSHSWPVTVVVPSEFAMSHIFTERLRCSQNPGSIRAMTLLLSKPYFPSPQLRSPWFPSGISHYLLHEVPHSSLRHETTIMKFLF